MKTLSNHALLIDADCPMCQLYGKAFERTDLLEAGSCKSYQYTDEATSAQVDMNRARNEIALLNLQTQQVHYGVDALRLILTQRFGWLRHLIDPPMLYWFWKKLYRFVSTNRKVIAPAALQANQLDCRPDLHVQYRWLYIVLVVGFASATLSAFCQPIYRWAGWSVGFGTELGICTVQLLWQSALLGRRLRNQHLDYLGNLMTVSLIGALLLLPGVWLAPNIGEVPPIAWLTYFAVVVALMLLEHLRRCRVLGLGYLPSVLWVLYRVVIVLLFSL